MSALKPVAAFALGGLNLLQISLAQEQQEAQARARKAQIEAEHDAEQRRRERALATAGASVRARLGAQGSGAAGGSGEALLAGLIDESEADTLESLAERQRRLQNVDTGLAFDRRFNLLDRARLANSFLLR